MGENTNARRLFDFAGIPSRAPIVE